MVGFAIPIGVVFMKHKMGKPFLCVSIHPVNVGLGNGGVTSGLQGLFERRILLWVDFYRCLIAGFELARLKNRI